MANLFQRIGSWAKVFWKVLNQQPEIFSDVAFSPDGTTMALAGKSAVWLLDTTNGEELTVLVGVRMTSSSRFSSCLSLTRMKKPLR